MKAFSDIVLAAFAVYGVYSVVLTVKPLFFRVFSYFYFRLTDAKRLRRRKDRG